MQSRRNDGASGLHFVLTSLRVRICTVASFLCHSQSHTCQAFSEATAAAFVLSSLNTSALEDAVCYGESEGTLATIESFKAKQIGHSTACQLPICKDSP